MLVLLFRTNCDLINRPVSETVSMESHQRLRLSSDLSDLLFSCCCRLLIFFFALCRANWTSSHLLDAINTPSHRKHSTHTLHDNQQTLQVTHMEKGCDWLTAKDSEPSAGEILMSSQHQVAQVSQVLILSVKDSIEMFRVYSIIILIEWCEYLFVNLMQHVSNM